jgi:phenylpyruvate tautomerase PptA (4-oxalocrotonate tautomerase family)
MPLVRIDVLEGRSDEQLAAIGAAIHRAMVECLDVPERDQFQIITEHRRGRLIYNPAYLDVARTDGVLIAQILLGAGRTTEQKAAFYARAAELLVDRAGLRREDVTITLHENTRADWSFGNGIASYLTLPKAQWK